MISLPRLHVRLCTIIFLNTIDAKKFSESLARKFNYDYDKLDFENIFILILHTYIARFNILDNINKYISLSV